MTQVREERGFLTTINLVGDEGQLRQGVLLRADGVRPKTMGSITTRQGRILHAFNIPGYTGEVVTDGSLPAVTNAGLYGEIKPFRSSFTPVRGYTPYYDQRLAWTDEATHPNLKNQPLAMNHVFKSGGAIRFNGFVGGESLQVSGDMTFDSWDTVAQFIQYEDKLFVVDESTDAKMMQRSNKADQTHAAINKYEVSRMGIKWPDFPTIAAGSSPSVVQGTPASSDDDVAWAGLYKFRIALENKFGRVSNPGLPGTTIVAVHFPSSPIDIRIDWSALVAGFPTEATHVRIYFQFVPADTSAAEPSAWHLVQRQEIGTANPRTPGGTDEWTFYWNEFRNRSISPLMGLFNGYPPRLKAMVIINDVAFGIAMPDRIVRETFLQDGNKRAVIDEAVVGPFGTELGRIKSYESTELTEIEVDDSYLFISEPGAPDAMEAWVQIGEGGERGVGLAALGSRCVIFTDRAIHIYDPAARVLAKAFAHIGALSRDSIKSTEEGVFFLGTDGVPRLFNGATVQTVGQGVEPLFSKRYDQQSYLYKKFDRDRSHEVVTMAGNNVVMMTYPILSGPTDYNLLIMRTKDPFPIVIDTESYPWLHYLTEEGRILGIADDGAWYFLEEGQGTADEQISFTDEDFRFYATTRKMGTSMSTQWFKFEVEFDGGGSDFRIVAKIDENPSLTHTYEITTSSQTGRETRVLYLPPHFKGRYIDFTFWATIQDKPISIYRLHIEEGTRGVI